MTIDEDDELKKERAEKIIFLFNSLDKKAQKIVQEIKAIECQLENAVIHDIQYALNELGRKNCNKAILSIVGETSLGKAIKSKDEIIIHIVG